MRENEARFLNVKPVDVPVLAVTGGKGGTGKTTVAVNLAAALSMKGLSVLLVDADVDCPNVAVLLGIELKNGEEIRFFKPEIDEEKCVRCGKCAEVCLEHALVHAKDAVPAFFEELCSGCGACRLVCPVDAIKEGYKVLGKIFSSKTGSLEVVTGELRLTEARSPLVVKATKDYAYKMAMHGGYDLIIVDTAPGIHSSVVRALQGADLALAVTEPSHLGAHDLERILQLGKEIRISLAVVLNRADIPSGIKSRIYGLCDSYGVEIVSEIPFDEELLKAYVNRVPVVQYNLKCPSAQALSTLADYVSRRLG